MPAGGPTFLKESRQRTFDNNQCILREHRERHI